MVDYNKIAQDSFVRYTVGTVAKDITGRCLSIFWGCASYAASSLLSNYLFYKKESMEPNDIYGSLCPEEIDVKLYLLVGAAGVVGVVSLGMAIMYCAQHKQPSTQITYNVQNNFQIISKNDQIIDR